MEICCPHCGFWIPVTGAGSKMVVKKKGMGKPIKDPDAPAPPKKGLRELLGDHYDQYWILTALFTGEKKEFQNKNWAPMESAGLYMQHIAAGATDAGILAAAQRLRRLTSDLKFMPKLSRWLAEQDFTLPATGTEAQMPSRFEGRTRAE